MFDREFDEHNIGEDLQRLIDRFEAMILDNDISFFEEEDFEQIIDYYEVHNKASLALQAIDIAIKQYPFSEFFLIRKAELLFEQKEFAPALAMLDKAEILDAGDLDVYFLRAEIYTAQSKYKLALQTLKHALDFSNSEEEDEIYISMAEVYESWEKLDKVFECLKKALEINPLNEDALNKIWFAVDMIENYDESIKLHLALIDRDPYSFLAWYNLGQAYFGLELYEKAAYAFEYVAIINEEYDMVYRDWGEALCRMEEYNKAIEVYETAIKISEPYEEIFFGLGICYERLNSFNKSRYYFRKAAHVNPFYDEAFFRIGEVYRKEERYKEALGAYKKALKLDDENVEYLVAFAEGSYQLGHVTEAISNYQLAVSLKPELRKNWIKLVVFLYEQGEYELALNTLEDAIMNCGEESDLSYLKAAFYFGTGRRNAGFEQLATALSLDYNQYTLLFDWMPQLKNDNAVCNLIEQYK